MRARALLLVPALLAVACSAGDDEPAVVEDEEAPSALDRLDDGPTPTDAVLQEAEPSSGSAPADEPVPPPEPTADLDEAIPGGVADGLILVQDFDSPAPLASYESDGDLVAVYAEDDGSLSWLPIWAPDGRSVAFASTSDTTTWSLVVVTTDGSDRTVYDLPGRPDYLTFDPTASRVLALIPVPDGGFSIVVVELDGDGDGDGGDDWTVIDTGAPYFTDFAPDGERLVGHASTEMKIVTNDGSVETIGPATNGHQTPVWHPDGRRVYFTNDIADPATLVEYDVTSGASSDVATFGNFVLFAVDPTGERLAVSTFDLDAAAEAEAATISADDMRSGLWVIELVGGDATRLHEVSTTAPMWDPTGTRVLVRDAAAGVGNWTAYGLDGDELTSVRRDINASLLPNQLPFWDQFVRSQTLWSPAGDRFVHVGADETGRAGVWIQDVSADGASTFLVEGELAFWSPT